MTLLEDHQMDSQINPIVVQVIAVGDIPWKATTEVDSQAKKVSITVECNKWEAQETMDRKAVE